MDKYSRASDLLDDAHVNERGRFFNTNYFIFYSVAQQKFHFYKNGPLVEVKSTLEVLREHATDKEVVDFILYNLEFFDLI